MFFKTKNLIALLVVIGLLSALSVNTVSAAVPTLETNPGVLAPLGVTAGSTAGNLTKRIQEFIFKMITENLKRSALDALVSQMVTSVAGGQPQFVENWETYLQSHYDLGAQEAIRDLESQGFFSAPAPSLSTSPGRGIGQKEPFSFDNFLNSWQPQNNPYGRQIIAEQYIESRASSRMEAAKNDAIAGGGFLSTKDATGNITTPGSVVQYVAGRAVTADIDYIVNTQDIESFLSSFASSIFNNLTRQFGGGLVGVAQNILGGGAIGGISLFGDGNPLGALPFDNILSQAPLSIAFDNNAAANFASSIFDQSVNRSLDSFIQDSAAPAGSSSFYGDFISNPEIQDIIQQELDSSSSLTPAGSSSSLLPNARASKEQALAEIQRTSSYLDDISRSLNSTNSNINPSSLINDVKSELLKIESLLRSELNQITDGSLEDSVTERRIGFIQRELLRDLYNADITFSMSNNFDVSNNLPIHLNTVDLPTNNRAENSYKIYRETRTKKDQEGELPQYVCSGCHFFISSTLFRTISGSYGDFNYFGVNIPPEVTVESIGGRVGREISAFFIFSPNRLNYYLTNLNNKLSLYEELAPSNILRNNENQLDNTFKLIGLLSETKNKKDIIAQEFAKAKFYLGDIISMLESNTLNFSNSSINIFNLYTAIEANMEIIINNKRNLLTNPNQVNEENLNQTISRLNDLQRSISSGGIINLYTAGIDTGHQSPAGNLPIISRNDISVREDGQVMNDLTLNVNRSLLPNPYFGNNFLNQSSEFFWLPANVNDYVSSLNNTILALTSNNLLPTITIQEISTAGAIGSITPERGRDEGIQTSTSINIPPVASGRSVKIQFIRYFYDNEGFQAERLTGDNNGGINISLAETIMGTPNNSYKLESSRNVNIVIDHQNQNNYNSSNSGWIFRSYDIADISSGSIPLSCRRAGLGFSACAIKNIRVISY